MDSQLYNQAASPFTGYILSIPLNGFFRSIRSNISDSSNFQFHWMDSTKIRYFHFDAVDLSIPLNGFEEVAKLKEVYRTTAFNSIEWIQLVSSRLSLSSFRSLSIPLNGFMNPYPFLTPLTTPVKLSIPLNGFEAVYLLPFPVLSLSLSFNSIEWIPRNKDGEGVDTLTVPFNSIEWIQALQPIPYTKSITTFNSIEWIRFSVPPQLYDLFSCSSFQFHWMDSRGFSPATGPGRWNPLSIPLNGFIRPLFKVGDYDFPFNSIEWILWCCGATKEGLIQPVFQFHWMDSEQGHEDT